MNTSEMIENLKYVIDALEFMQEMRGVHNCNDCGYFEKCEYRPNAKEDIRWNCPFWGWGKQNEETD